MKNNGRVTFKEVFRELFDWPDLVPVAGFLTYSYRIYNNARKRGDVPSHHSKEFLKDLVRHLPTLGLAWPSEERRMLEELGPKKYNTLSKMRDYGICCNCGLFTYQYLMLTQIIPRVVPIAQKSLETLL